MGDTLGSQTISTKLQWLAEKCINRVAKLCAAWSSVFAVIYLLVLIDIDIYILRNRMWEIFTYGSVGRALGNQCLYPEPDCLQLIGF